MGEITAIDCPRGSLSKMVGNAILSLNIKIMVLLFITYLALNTDVFIVRILSKFSGATDAHCYPSTKGTIIIGILLIIAYAAFDILVRADII